MIPRDSTSTEGSSGEENATEECGWHWPAGAHDAFIVDARVGHCHRRAGAIPLLRVEVYPNLLPSRCPLRARPKSTCRRPYARNSYWRLLNAATLSVNCCHVMSGP